MRTSACLRRPRRYGDPVATAPGAKRFLPVIVAIISLLWFGPGSAAAHPLGNFTINHFARITLERGKV
ncbi:MAG TPA: hypothetical protein VEZ90_01620, partial [Blastocatellia bacterium]|nr:hypothetical protein [Blastocatellia bacterium]